MTTVAIMQPYFYPYAGYFRLFSRADLFVVYDCVQFPRRGWVHRNRLTGAGGQLQWLTLRLAHAAQDTAIRDMRLEPFAMEQLAADLRRFPAFDRAEPELRARLPLLEGGATLVDYLERNLQAVLDCLGSACRMVRSSSLDIDPSLRGQQRILAIARRLGADRYLNAPGGRDLYESDAFARDGIRLEFLEPAAGSQASLLERLCSEEPESIRADVR
ncbi:MAG: WbqC family protein [bacterium]